MNAATAGAIGEAGEVYYLDMGEPIRVMDLAEDLIRLTGMQPNHDMESSKRCGLACSNAMPMAVWSSYSG